MIEEGYNIITDPSRVASAMNTFYANIAANIGRDQNPPTFNNVSTCDFIARSTEFYTASTHHSIKNIEENLNKCDFTFHHIGVCDMAKAINNLDPCKATGCDGISAKLLILAQSIITPHLTSIFNTCIDTGTFPDLCKLADVKPIFKKADPLVKKNYRPVSIITAISKLFERLLEGQLQLFQNSILHPSVSAFRLGHSCQSVLLKLTEDIRSELDRGQITGLVLMDLSKAFDSIPHPLFISKLHAYGMTCSALNLISSYLIERKQRVKLRGCTSDWAPITKGVPQGSVLGPMFFNLFLNDILFALNEAVIYN